MEKENYYAEASNLPLGIKLLRFYYKYIGAYFPRLSAQLFWKVFCMPKKRKIREKPQVFLDTADRQTINFNDLKIQSYTWGTGEKKILIVHGWEGMSADFKEIITELISAGYKVMAFDLPAHGKSSGKRTHIPMIMELLKKIIAEHGPFYGIVSHSLGAAASALTLANLNGTSHLSKMVLMGLHPFPFIFFEQFRRALRIDDTLYNKCLVYVESKIKININEFSVPMLVQNISVDNVLLVHDEKDGIVNIQKIMQLNKDWDKSEMYSGNHGGHFKHFKHVDVVERIIDFMELS